MYEYKTENESGALQEQLCRLGRDGWLLVDVTSDATLIMMRPLPTPVLRPALEALIEQAGTRTVVFARGSVEPEGGVEVTGSIVLLGRAHISVAIQAQKCDVVRGVVVRGELVSSDHKIPWKNLVSCHLSERGLELALGKPIVVPSP